MVQEFRNGRPWSGKQEEPLVIEKGCRNNQIRFKLGLPVLAK